MTVPVYYWNKQINFGDALNPLILQNIFNVEVEPVSPRDAKIFPIGSILQKIITSRWNLGHRIKGLLSPEAVIWTSGFLKAPKEGSVLCRKTDITALRGEKTKQCMERILGCRIDVPLGDGGLLMPLLLKERPQKKYDLGIIPHFVDVQSPRFRQLQEKFPQAKFISPEISPDDNAAEKCLELLQTIASCETVLSSSLHGLIAADALNIPNGHVVDDKLNGSFKFDDYRSAFGDSDHPVPIDGLLQDRITLKEIFSRHQLSADHVAEIAAKIRAAFRVGKE